MTTMHNLLLKTYFGGWHKLYIEIVIYYFLEKTYVAWNENKVACLLIINVFAIYPNTSYKHLLYNLHKKRIDIKVIN